MAREIRITIEVREMRRPRSRRVRGEEHEQPRLPFPCRPRAEAWADLRQLMAKTKRAR
jgi:hypothetical protein